MARGFEVGVPLTRVWKDDTGQMRFEGIASSTALDRQQERMTENAIRKMATFTGIDLLPSHRAGVLEELGTVTETWADNRTLRVAGVLDEANPEARRLFEKVQGGRRYALSVGGRVLKAFWADDPEVKERVKHIDDVVLDHVALCRPGDAANPDTYLAVMAKSVDLREPEGLAQRIAQAVAEAIRPLAKQQGGAEAGDETQTSDDDAPDPAVPEPAAAEVESAQGALGRVLERQSHLARAVASLAERLAALEKQRGRPTAIAGQERESNRPATAKQPASIWKGVF